MQSFILDKNILNEILLKASLNLQVIKCMVYQMQYDMFVSGEPFVIEIQ